MEGGGGLVAQRHKDFGVGVVLGVGVGTEINRVLMKMMMEARGHFLTSSVQYEDNKKETTGSRLQLPSSRPPACLCDRAASGGSRTVCEEDGDAAVLLGLFQLPVWVGALRLSSIMVRQNLTMPPF